MNDKDKMVNNHQIISLVHVWVNWYMYRIMWDRRGSQKTITVRYKINNGKNYYN